MAPSDSGDVSVMIVDDHEVVRRGIAEVVGRAEGMTVVAEAGTVAEAVRRAALVRPRVMLVDLQLPDGTGIDVLRSVAESLPGTRAVVLTSFDDDDALAAALDAGAAAYVLKSVHGAEIAQVIRSVAAGRTLLDERTLTRHQAGHDDPTADLTPSEHKVVDLIGEGMSNREIAERLGVSEKTVKNHVTSVLAKMGLQRRTQVTAWIAGRRTGAWRGDPR
jgi:two-component system response regulator DevR